MSTWIRKIGQFAAVTGVLVSGLAGPGSSVHADTYGLFVSGLGGDDQYEKSFLESGRLLYEAAVASGLNEGRLFWLAEKTDDDSRIKSRSTKDAVLQSLETLRQEMKDGDLLWMILIGHGSYRDGASKINLPGPDLTDKDLAAALAKFSTEQPIVFVNTASASGGFLEALSGPGRVILTATKSPAQRNQTVFGTFFAAAFSERKADSDQDGFVSALEAFVHANEEVKRHYEDRNLLVTENALLDDNGDREGSLSPDALGGDNGEADGAVAARLVLGASALARVEQTPENIAAVERKADLQRKLDALRRQKGTLEEGLYLSELQSILVEIARIDRGLRSQNSDSPKEVSQDGKPQEGSTSDGGSS